LLTNCAADRCAAPAPLHPDLSGGSADRRLLDRRGRRGEGGV